MAKTQEQITRGKEITHQRLVEAAIELFAEKGYHDAVVDDIVKAAGASKGAFYFHFPSKEDVFIALIEGLAARLAHSLEAAIAQAQGGTARVEAALEAVFKTVSRHRKLAKILLIGSVGISSAFDQRAMELHARFAQLIKAHLDQAVATGEVLPIDTEVAAYAWLGAVNEVVVRWLHTLQPPHLESLAPEMRDLLLRSLGVPVKTATSEAKGTSRDPSEQR